MAARRRVNAGVSFQSIGMFSKSWRRCNDSPEVLKAVWVKVESYGQGAKAVRVCEELSSLSWDFRETEFQHVMVIERYAGQNSHEGFGSVKQACTACGVLVWCGERNRCDKRIYR